jgi:hypothetical protein
VFARLYNTGDNAHYVHPFSSSTEARHIRKQKLDQREFKIHNKSTTLDQCGHFDEKYVEVLKGEHRRFTKRA